MECGLDLGSALDLGSSSDCGSEGEPILRLEIDCSLPASMERANFWRYFQDASNLQFVLGLGSHSIIGLSEARALVANFRGVLQSEIGDSDAGVSLLRGRTARQLREFVELQIGAAEMAALGMGKMDGAKDSEHLFQRQKRAMAEHLLQQSPGLYSGRCAVPLTRSPPMVEAHGLDFGDEHSEDGGFQLTQGVFDDFSLISSACITSPFVGSDHFADVAMATIARDGFGEDFKDVSDLDSDEHCSEDDAFGKSMPLPRFSSSGSRRRVVPVSKRKSLVRIQLDKLEEKDAVVGGVLATDHLAELSEESDWIDEEHELEIWDGSDQSEDGKEEEELADRRSAEAFHRHFDSGTGHVFDDCTGEKMHVLLDDRYSLRGKDEDDEVGGEVVGVKTPPNLVVEIGEYMALQLSEDETEASATRSRWGSLLSAERSRRLSASSPAESSVSSTLSGRLAVLMHAPVGT